MLCVILVLRVLLYDRACLCKYSAVFAAFNNLYLKGSGFLLLNRKSFRHISMIVISSSSSWSEVTIPYTICSINCTYIHVQKKDDARFFRLTVCLGLKRTSHIILSPLLTRTHSISSTLNSCFNFGTWRCSLRR